MNTILLSKWEMASFHCIKCSFFELLPVSASSLSARYMFVIYVSMLLDNILRSVIVPILPDLVKLDEDDANDGKAGKHAILLASKNIIQLVANSFVAVFVYKVGYQRALLAGNIVLSITSLLFAVGNNFQILLMARGLHGVASTIISVSGMSVCAENFANDEKLRNKFMGIMIGSDAVGVLCAYTIGILVFNVAGKCFLFSTIAFIILLNGYSLIDVDHGWYRLMGNPIILMISLALFLSSSTIAILEPCLPVWIEANVSLEKWQSELIFLPDSVGYLISTSVTPLLSVGVTNKWRTVMAAALLIGTSSILISTASTLLQLSVTHFCIGFGIGVVDSTVVPMLADFVDIKRSTRYSSVYALEHGVTSFAYICGYMLTAELVEIIRFPSLILAIGIINIIYAAIIFAYESLIPFQRNQNWTLKCINDVNVETELMPSRCFDYGALNNVLHESD